MKKAFLLYMRLWSLHPKYLDPTGLVALWRESLLAKHVLEGRTKGYKNHPQLIRFKNQDDPVHAINFYLCKIHEEAVFRKYSFDETKVNWNCTPCIIEVTSGQIEYEWNHLKKKLLVRSPNSLQLLLPLNNIEVHPMFRVIHGQIESWEIL